MEHDLVPLPARRDLLRAGFAQLPAAIERAGERAAWRFIEFFTANIRNKNTRAAYAHAVAEFFRWCEEHGVVDLERIKPVAIAAYVEQHPAAAPTVKQHIAAIRMLFDWLVVGQVVEVNPASAVRGPKHVVKRGKTPVLTADQARTLLDSIETDSLAGLRDRALIGLMVYSFARVSAATRMRVGLLSKRQALVVPSARKKAASCTTFQPITMPKRIWTPTSRPATYGIRRKAPCSAASTSTGSSR